MGSPYKQSIKLLGYYPSHILWMSSLLCSVLWIMFVCDEMIWFDDQQLAAIGNLLNNCRQQRPDHLPDCIRWLHRVIIRGILAADIPTTHLNISVDFNHTITTASHSNSHIHATCINNRMKRYSHDNVMKLFSLNLTIWYSHDWNVTCQ